MTNWIEAEEAVKPVVARTVLAYCPDWNSSGYQVCYWDGKTFMYEEQPNDDFHTYVSAWAIFMDAD